MNDELAKLIDPSLDLEVPGERDPFVTRLDAEEVIADLLRVNRLARPKLCFQSPEECPLEQSPHRKQRGTPLPCRVHIREGAVMQLEADVEGQLQVVVRERIP